MPSFTWVPFYEELASLLREYRDRQGELIELLEKLRATGLTIMPLEDKDVAGSGFRLKEIDPFTFFGTFNRGTKLDNRIKICGALKAHFGMVAPVPADFADIPILNNQKSWFFAYLKDRKPDDITRLWRIFLAALDEGGPNTAEFADAFDQALEVRNTNTNLTMGLFWMRPGRYVSLDGTMRQYLKIKLPKEGISFAFYKTVLEEAHKRTKNLPELSHQAYVGGASPPTPPAKPAPIEDVEYWMVGAYWDSHTPSDQTDRFLAEGVWVNGYQDDRFDEAVRQMKVGDRIAIKAATTQRADLPFDNRNKTVSKMLVKATGTIVSNPRDGRTVEVEWDPKTEPRAWYFYTCRPTVWHLRKDVDYAQRLIRFVFQDEPQDYDFFTKKWWDEGGSTIEGDDAQPYSVDDLLAEGVFLTATQVDAVLRRLRAKKNVVLQGAPGVGKTFVARKLAYALMEARDDARITLVQFHPSFSYEDFVRGYRPTGEAGKFALRDGPFVRLCRQAADDPDRPHVLLIDEINRGNLSQVFGEVFMLLEGDKRGRAHAVTPLYQHEGASDGKKGPKSGDSSEKLWVPENVYVIGTMNIADRSLALVDFALRRRFAFVTLEPAFETPTYKKWLRERGMADAVCDRIIARMNALNTRIAADTQLGPAYRIGHSFFCPKGDAFGTLGDQWFDEIVETEIEPLLHEYWHDAPEKVKAVVQDLRA